MVKGMSDDGDSGDGEGDGGGGGGGFRGDGLWLR